MKKIKVRANNMEDLLSMNETMVRYKNLKFDVHSGSIDLDGKSIIGLLGLGIGSFEIHISGESHEDLAAFIKEIKKYEV